MELAVCENIDQVSADQWNALVPENNPFLRHEFLAALEHHGCVGEEFGWLPRHLVAWDGGRLAAAVPLYLKHNSYGEFVFDFAWADAYRRQGLEYYPKLVAAVPYTPATGNRLLAAPGSDLPRLRRQLLRRALDLVAEERASSLHWLFVTEEEHRDLEQQGLAGRIGVQFHWENRGYRVFEDFLGALNARRRKNIRRERRAVADAGLELRVVHGDQATADEWLLFSRFYVKTFEEKYSLPTLNLGFFREVAARLPRQVILVLAYAAGECVAGALLFRSDSTLYGRHWGCLRDYNGLHFEACYYQGIEYCIREDLRRFEPGAQGEHKIWRGFLPTLTYSNHWIVDRGFKVAIETFLRRERAALLDYRRTLETSSPFRRTETCSANGAGEATYSD